MGADLFIMGAGCLKQPPGSPKSKMPRRRDTGKLEPDEPVLSAAYFRDSYNLGSVLWTHGLSWWRDVLPHFDKHSRLSGKALRKFRDRVANTQQKFVTHEDLRVQGIVPQKKGPRSVNGLRKFHARKREELLAFLNCAIANDLPVICSL